MKLKVDEMDVVKEIRVGRREMKELEKPRTGGSLFKAPEECEHVKVAQLPD